MQPVHIEQIAVGAMANFSYLIVDESTKESLYVDPGWEAEKVIGVARKKDWKIVGIVVTHFHFDHCKALPEAWQLLQVPVWLPKGEGEALAEPQYKISWMEEGSEISFGEKKLHCLSMPGHTPNEICLLIENHLITGDVLFVDGCGRVDLPGSDPQQMYQSLKRLSEMPDDIVIYPGHDYGPKKTDTLKNQKKTNPYLLAFLKGKKEFFGARGV